MPRRAAAGGRPEIASSWSIVLRDLQACISEQVRIIIHYALDVVRLLFCNRGWESARGAEREPVKTADEGTEEKESPAADHEDYNQQRADDDLRGGDDDLRGGDDDLHGSDDDDLHGSDDDDLQGSDDDDYDEEEDWNPPGLSITYDGDSSNLQMAYCFSRDLIELLSVRPHFPFAGTFACFNDRSAYHFSSPKGQPYRYADSQGNLILRAQGGAIEDGFQVRVEIPEDDNGIEEANYSFRVKSYTFNRVITRTIPTIHCREIDVTFVALYRAIQANVFVNIDLVADGGGSSAAGGTIYYVYGEITAQHHLYGDQNVMLFYREEENKAKVIDGKVPLLRPWAAVPVYLDPLLVIKLSLHVATDPQHDPDGHTVSFQGDLSFDRDQYNKSICNVHHGEVKVGISYG